MNLNEALVRTRCQEIEENEARPENYVDVESLFFINCFLMMHLDPTDHTPASTGVKRKHK